MTNRMKVLALGALGLVLGLGFYAHSAFAYPTDPPDAPWRLAGQWAPLSAYPTATANATVNVRSTPTSRPNGWAAGVSNANVIGRLTNGQTVEIIGYGLVRAWVDSDISRRSDIGYFGPSRWVNIRAGELEGWVYIAFLTFP